MSSFYGGRKGTSLFIKASYKTIADMVAEFKKGAAYEEVGYNEYVIIDTDNKNNPDNGKLYRRGLDFSNAETGGAEYVGQIVGPSGNAPLYHSVNYDELAGITGDVRVDSGDKVLDVVTGDLISGKENDDITWRSVSVRDDWGTETNVYLGFKIPYTVFEWETTAVDPYNADGNYADMTAIQEKAASADHPFYYLLNLDVPKGVKGNSLKDIEIFGTAKAGILYYTDATYTSSAGTVLENTTAILENDYAYIMKNNVKYYIKLTDITDAKLRYHSVSYDTKKDGVISETVLNDWNVISDVVLDDNGTLTFNYTSQDPDVYTNVVRWISNITLGQDGKFNINYNDSTNMNTVLKWIDNATVDNNGTIRFVYNTNTESVPDYKEIEKLIKWVNSITLSQDGKFNIKWNNGAADTSSTLEWIDNVAIDTDGTISFIFNTNTEASPRKFTKSKYLKCIDDISLSDNGTLTISFNTKGTPSTFEKKINWITEASLDTNGKFSVKFNNDNISNIDSTFKFVNDLTYSNENQTFKLSYNTGDTKDVDLNSTDNYFVIASGVTEDNVKSSIAYQHLFEGGMILVER